MPFLAFVVLPLAVLPNIYTFLAVLFLGLPVAVALIPEEKPDELDPAIWHPDDGVRAARLAVARADWRRLRGRP